MSANHKQTAGDVSQGQVVLIGVAAAVLALAASLSLQLTPASAPAKVVITQVVFIIVLAFLMQRVRGIPSSPRYWAVMLALAVVVGAGSWAIAAS